MTEKATTNNRKTLKKKKERGKHKNRKKKKRQHTLSCSVMDIFTPGHVGHCWRWKIVAVSTSNKLWETDHKHKHTKKDMWDMIVRTKRVSSVSSSKKKKKKKKKKLQCFPFQSEPEAVLLFFVSECECEKNDFGWINLSWIGNEPWESKTKQKTKNNLQSFWQSSLIIFHAHETQLNPAPNSLFPEWILNVMRHLKDSGNESDSHQVLLTFRKKTKSKIKTPHNEHPWIFFFNFHKINDVDVEFASEHFSNTNFHQQFFHIIYHCKRKKKKKKKK